MDKKERLERLMGWGINPNGYDTEKHYVISRRQKLYFICDENCEFLKIGISTNPEERRLGLQTGNPKKLILLFTFYASQKIENKLHKYLQQYQLIGEWYPLTGDNGDYIFGLLKQLCLGYFCGMSNFIYNSLFANRGL